MSDIETLKLALDLINRQVDELDKQHDGYKSMLAAIDQSRAAFLSASSVLAARLEEMKSSVPAQLDFDFDFDEDPE
jgi:hypothetical protein